MDITKIVAIVVIVVLAALYISWKIFKNGLRKTAIDFIVEAERLYDNGGTKKSYVIEQLSKIIPFPFSLFVSEKIIDQFMEKVFEEIKDALHYKPELKEGE